MTDFMVFLRTGEDVIREANYNVMGALTELNFTNIKQNLGFYFGLGYWGLYLVLVLIFELIGKLSCRRDFFHKLFHFTNRDEELPIYDENGELEERVAKLEDILAVNKKVNPISSPKKKYSSSSSSSNLKSL